MSFTEFAQAEQAAKDLGAGSASVPVFGDAELAASVKKPDLGNVRVRYVVANMADPSDRSLVEHLFTQSLQCQNQVQKEGDVCVFKEESAFTNKGQYMVAMKYAVMESADTGNESSLEDNAAEDFEV